MKSITSHAGTDRYHMQRRGCAASNSRASHRFNTAACFRLNRSACGVRPIFRFLEVATIVWCFKLGGASEKKGNGDEPHGVSPLQRFHNPAQPQRVKHYKQDWYFSQKARALRSLLVDEDGGHAHAARERQSQRDAQERRRTAERRTRNRCTWTWQRSSVRCACTRQERSRSAWLQSLRGGVRTLRPRPVSSRYLSNGQEMLTDSSTNRVDLLEIGRAHV